MDEIEINKPTKNIGKMDYIIIGLFMVSCYIGNLGQYTIMSQYIYHRLSVEKGFIDYANGSQCFNNNNSSNSETQKEIQSAAAQYNIYAQLSCGIPSMIVVLFSGPLSDLYGRKLIILISWIGSFVGTMFNVILVATSGPLWLYILGQFLSGVGGNYGAMLSGIFSLISDSTGHHNRNSGIIIIEITLGISLIVSQAFLGIWLKQHNFFWPILTFGLLFVSSGIIWVFIKETRRRIVNRNHRFPFHIFLSIKKMINIFSIGSRFYILLFLCTLAFFIHTFNFFGNLTLITVYLFGKPFCWHSDILGYYRSISSAIIQIGILFSFLLLKLNVNEILIVEIGFITNISSKLLFAIAPIFPKSVGDYFIYFASLDLFSGASVSLLRSISSKLVSPDEYGALFGMMSSVETLASLSGGVIYNAVYNATFVFYYGFCYALAAVLLFVAFLLMMWFYILRRKSKNVEFQTLI